MNIFDILVDSFKPFMDQSKRPLNVMEVSNLWFFYAATENSLRNEEIALNIVQDNELRDQLKYAKEKIHVPILEEIGQLLRNEGVPLPAGTAEKPVNNYRDTPEGAKLNDKEIANMLSFNLVLGITYASRGLTESIRADVGLMFSKFIIKKAMMGLTVKQLMDKRGWLRIPPYYKA